MNSLRLTLIYSLILAKSFVLCGCSAKTPTKIGNPDLERRMILDRYEAYPHGSYQIYLEQLSGVISQSARLKFGPKITLLTTQKPIALSTSGGEVFISRGLVHQLQDEGSLLFVLAHEFAHSLLEHHTNSNPEPSFEFSADAIALSIITQAGYSPQSAIHALTDAYGIKEFKVTDDVSTSIGSQTMLHPPLRDRILAISAAITGERFGSSPSRNFNAFRNSLQNN